VTFTVTAKVAGGTWTYPSSLDVLENVGGLTSVDWSPTVLYPKLQAGDTLSAGSLSAADTPAIVVDRHGVPLTAAKYPSLADIITSISQHGQASVPGGSGGDGKGVEVVDASGDPLSTATVFAAAKAPKITTTIDAALQAKAENAVRNSVLQNLPASVVAIDWRTGNILAVAYANTGSDGDTALLGALAPGSTMKIITSAALFDRAGRTPDSPAPCPSTVEAGSTLFHNDFTTEYLGDTIRSAFARSCNTAFIKTGFRDLVHTAADTGDLAKEATDVFGLGSQNGGWSIGGGVATHDASIPANPDLATAAADLIGQGQVTMNPLALASIAATVRDAGFKQPRILPNQKQVPAPQQISGTTAANLQVLMRASAHDAEGTARPRVGGYADTGAKTGTSEVGTSTITTNGWFTTYNDQISVGALVQGGTTGVSSAGYIAAALIGATE
jgi:cell division protein FtsI/penicillin-binding protein 2